MVGCLRMAGRSIEDGIVGGRRTACACEDLELQRPASNVRARAHGRPDSSRHHTHLIFRYHDPILTDFRIASLHGARLLVCPILTTPLIHSPLTHIPGTTAANMVLPHVACRSRRANAAFGTALTVLQLTSRSSNTSFLAPSLLSPRSLSCLLSTLNLSTALRHGYVSGDVIG